MDSSNGQNSKAKNIRASILTGIGYAIGSFVAGIIVEWMIVVFFLQYVGDSAGMIFMVFLFVLVVLLSVVVGIVGGRRTYKRLFEKK